MDPEPYRPALEAAAAHRLPMVCVNPDRHVMVGTDRLICAGALADIYLELGGSVFEVGKPDPAVYDPVMEMLGLTDRARVLAIGDTPHTDLAGAQAAGIDALWAMTGLPPMPMATTRTPRRCGRSRCPRAWTRSRRSGRCAGSGPAAPPAGATAPAPP